MLTIIEYAQKDFRGSVTYQYNTNAFMPKHEFVVKIIQSNVVEVHANFDQDFTGALRRFNEHCRLNIGQTVREVLVENALREFNISHDNIVAMHMANLTPEEKILMEQDAVFEQWAAAAV